MKTIDTKSLLIGILSTITVVALVSGTPDEGENIEIVPCAVGTAVLNHQTNTMYIYKMWNAKIGTTPSQTLQVSEDGSRLIAL